MTDSTDKKPHQGESNQTKQGFVALMSRLVVDEKLPFRFMFKTVPEHLNDTGWRVYTGYESEEFLEQDLVNMIPVTLEQMGQMDPSVKPLLDYNAGTVWERLPGASEWARVHDFVIPPPKVDVNITNDVDDFNDMH